MGMSVTEIPLIPSSLTLPEALKVVSKQSRSRNKLRIGAVQTSKSLLRKQAKLIVLDSDCPNNIKEIITSLSEQNNVPVLNVENAQQLCGSERVKLDETVKGPKVACYSIINSSESPEFLYLMNEISK